MITVYNPLRVCSALEPKGNRNVTYCDFAELQHCNLLSAATFAGLADDDAAHGCRDRRRGIPLYRVGPS